MLYISLDKLLGGCGISLRMDGLVVLVLSRIMNLRCVIYGYRFVFKLVAIPFVKK